MSNETTPYDLAAQKAALETTLSAIDHMNVYGRTVDELIEIEKRE